MAAQGDREDKKLVIPRSQLRQHGEFWHVSVSERQKLRVPFLRTVLPPEVGESTRAMASTGLADLLRLEKKERPGEIEKKMTWSDIKKPTTPAVPRRSPIQVLNRPNTA